MVQRLLFDRVDAETAGAAVGRQHDRVVVPHAHEAQAALPFAQPAGARADVALHAPVVQATPVPRGVVVAVFHVDSL